MKLIDDKNKINNKQDKENKQYVKKTNIYLLSSTGRSGSTFLSALIKSFPITFYLFEPLRPLSRKFKLDAELSNSMLKEIFNCNLSKHHLDLLSTEYYPLFVKRNSCNELKKCPKKERLNDYCKKFNITVVKTIRTRLSSAETFMSSSDNVKIIHLIRDPRGFITSMIKVKWNMKPRKICDKLLQDINTSHTFKTKYSKR